MVDMHARNRDTACVDGFQALLARTLTHRGALAQLEKASGVKGSLIGRYRDGAVRPSPENLEKLAPALGVDYEDLLRLCGYLPGGGEPEVRDELAQRMHRLEGLLRHYPRGFWSAVIEANERMVQAAGALLPGESAVSSSAGHAISRADRGRNRPSDGRNDAFNAYYGRQPAALASH